MKITKAIIDILMKTDIHSKIYYEIKVPEGQKKVVDAKHQKEERSRIRVYGVNTDAKTRPRMIDLLRTFIDEEYEKVNSGNLVEEIAGLERKTNGKIEHSDTTHDDVLFSYLVIRYVWAYGTNLASFNIYKRSKTPPKESDETSMVDEVATRYSSVLIMNNKTTRDDSLTSQRIIDEWYAQQSMIQAREAEEEQVNQSSLINTIFNMNKF